MFCLSEIALTFHHLLCRDEVHMKSQWLSIHLLLLFSTDNWLEQWNVCVCSLWNYILCLFCGGPTLLPQNSGSFVCALFPNNYIVSWASLEMVFWTFGSLYRYLTTHLKRILWKGALQQKRWANPKYNDIYLHSVICFIFLIQILIFIPTFISPGIGNHL